MEKSDFDQLLQRYLTGQVTDEEKTKLEAWLEVMKTEDTTHLELTDADEQHLFQKITSKIESGKPIAEFRPVQIRRQKNNRWVMRIAASVAVVIAASYFIWQYTISPITTIDTFTSTTVDKMILNDGSLVWVKDNGKLVYYEKDNGHTRYAELTGEALFEVTKDPTRPFVIQCKDISIRVLGTSFSLRASSDSVVLKVLTGKVNVTSGVDNTSRQLEPFQQIIYTHGQWQQTSFSKNQLSTITAHTEYNMNFENATLREVLNRLEQKFNVTIISMESANACRLTADLTDHSLDTSLQLISEVLTITIGKTDSAIVINGKGCQ